MKKILLIIALCLSSVTQAAEILKVEAVDKWNQVFKRSVPYLDITALENGIEIYRVELNRGNCKYSPNGELPKRLNYGQTVSLVLGWQGNICNLLEVKVFTNKGSITYKLN